MARSTKEPLPSVSALLTLPTLWQHRCSQSRTENQMLPQEPAGCSSSARGCMQAPGLKSCQAIHHQFVWAFCSLCFSSLGGLPQRGLLEGGALEMLPASTSLLLTRRPGGTWCCCSDRDNYRTSKTSKGKTRLGVPKEKKRHFCYAFKYSLAFFKHKKLRTIQVTYLNSKTFQKQGNTTY